MRRLDETRASAGDARSRQARILPVANVSMSWLQTLVATVGAFVVTPALLAGLGDARYGVWLLINSFVMHLRILDLGMSTGTMKFCAGAEERGDAAELAKVFSTSVALFGAAGLLTLLITRALVAVLSWAYPTSIGEHQAVVLALGAGMGLELILRPYAASLRARSLFFVCDSIEIVTYLVFKLGLVLYFAKAGLSIERLCEITVAEVIARNVLVVSASLKLAPWTRRFAPRSADRVVLGKLARYGSANFLISLADVFRFQVDAAVIGYFLPGSLERVSIYGIGMRLVTVAFFAIGVIGAVLMPRFSGLSERGDADGIMRLLQRANLFTGLTTGFIFINIAAFGPQFLAIWIKKPWVSESAKIMLLMVPAYFVTLLHGPVSGLLSGSGKLRGQTAVTIAEAAANVLLSVALVRPLGIYGVCLGSAIPMLVVRGVVFPIVVRKELGIGVARYYRTHVPALRIMPAYALTIVGARFAPIHGYPSLLAGLLGNAAVFAALVWALVPEARDVFAMRPEA